MKDRRFETLAICLLITFFAGLAAALLLFSYFTPAKMMHLAGGCAAEGEPIGAEGMPNSCCQGLTPMGGWPGGYEGNCTPPPPPTGPSICSNCGNGICETETGENKCNCPQDCTKE